MGRRGVKLLVCLAAVALVALTAAGSARAQIRIKDITDMEGERSNFLTGIGLVVGLENTGARSASTRLMAIHMLQKFNQVYDLVGIQRTAGVFQTGNIAKVAVTAKLGPFARRGSQIDVLVSVMDDSTSLRGGTLLLTPLKGADGVDYAVAQGAVGVGGFRFATPGLADITPTASIQVNHPNVGFIEGGAIVEREARGEIVCNGQVRLLLREPDYETARAITKAVNNRFPESAMSLDGGTVNVSLPRGLAPTDVTGFVAEIGLLKVATDGPARVVINERTGTIVAGDNVRIDSVAIAHGNLTIATVEESFGFGFGGGIGGEGLAEVDVAEQRGTLRYVRRTTTLRDLAIALSRVGATPRDLIAIFQALKQSGALHADLVIQ